MSTTTISPLLRCGRCRQLTWSYLDDECLSCGEACGLCRGADLVWAGAIDGAEGGYEVCTHGRVR